MCWSFWFYFVRNANLHIVINLLDHTTGVCQVKLKYLPACLDVKTQRQRVGVLRMPLGGVSDALGRIPIPGIERRPFLKLVTCSRRLARF